VLVVVLDTNIIVSGTIQKAGHSAAILDAWRDGQFLLIVSEALLEEVRDVLHRSHIKKKYRLADEEIEKVLDDLRRYSKEVPGKLEVHIIQEDPEDNFLISAALEEEADYIISGNPHLKNLKEYKGIKIISPAEFVKILKEI
jgi:hypothetical protein